MPTFFCVLKFISPYVIADQSCGSGSSWSYIVEP